jgi:hypothetical protein
VIRSAVIALAVAALLGAAPLPTLDSQIVLQRYELEMSDAHSPKTVICSYTISQAGATDIEQRHELYRSGDDVRDETLVVDGQPLKPKIVTIGKREDRYAIARLAPRSVSYAMLFVRAVHDGSHLDYQYDATPLAASPSGFVIKSMVIDGVSFLPRQLTFSTASATASGTGTIQYGKQGGYWVPLAVTVDAKVNGKPARESIVWSDYRFPASLPAATFVAPRPLPHATLPPI